MRDCQDRTALLLPEYIHGLLDIEEARLVEDHLESCPECAMELRLLMKFEDEEIPEPPPWFFSTLPGKVTAQAGSRRRDRRRVFIPVWAGGVAAAAIAALLLLTPESASPPHTDLPEYAAVETTEALPLGLEEEILSVAGTYTTGLDRTLGLELEGVSEEIMVSADLIRGGYGYEMMDEETIRVFEDLVEEMIPERVRKKVMS